MQIDSDSDNLATSAQVQPLFPKVARTLPPNKRIHKTNRETFDSQVLEDEHTVAGETDEQQNDSLLAMLRSNNDENADYPADGSSTTTLSKRSGEYQSKKVPPPTANLVAGHEDLGALGKSPEVSCISARITTAAQDYARAPSGSRAQSTNSMAGNRAPNGLDQDELRQHLRNRDARGRLNNLHRQRDEDKLRRHAEYNRNYDEPDVDRKERQRCRQEQDKVDRRRAYDCRYGTPGANRGGHRLQQPPVIDVDEHTADSGHRAPENLNDCDGFPAFTARVHAIRCPANFKPNDIEKYDSKTDPTTWLRTCSTAICAINGDHDIMCAYFPFFMGKVALEWL